MNEGWRRLATVIDVICGLWLAMVIYGQFNKPDVGIFIIAGIPALLGLALSWVLKGFASKGKP